jgi:hypothetical protein
MWYLSQRPPTLPNLPLLQNALEQTHRAGRRDARLWREMARERLAQLDMQAIRDDVGPFLEQPRNAVLLTRENLEGVLKQ